MSTPDVIVVDGGPPKVIEVQLPGGPPGPVGPPGPAGPQGPPGASNAVYSGEWNWNNAGDATATGRVSVDQPNAWLTTTELRVNEITAGGVDTSTSLGKIGAGDGFYLQVKADASRNLKLTVTGAATDHGTWQSWPVTLDQGQGAAPTQNTPMQLSLLKAGAQVEEWLSGTGAPAGATGSSGDWYLDTATGNVYEKTAATTWTLRSNIKGPTGATGPQGTTGTQGIQGVAGPQGATGPGVAAGGTSGQRLTKTSGTDYATNWQDPMPVDSIIAAATRIIANLLAAGDAQPAWRVLGSGQMEWGAGGASAPDTNLYRSAVGQLKTDGSLILGSTLTGALIQSTRGLPSNCLNVFATGDSQPRIAIANDSRIIFGPGGSTAPDTTFARSAAGVLSLGTTAQKGSFRIFGAAAADLLLDHRVTTDAQARFYVRADGWHAWGDGTATQDTILQRLSDATHLGLSIAPTRTLAALTADSANLQLAPTINGAFTLTRLNYIECAQFAGTSTITDAAALSFPAAAGTHKAVDAGTTKTTPGTVNAWMKINVNGTIYYVPAYTSKTT